MTHAHHPARLWKAMDNDRCACRLCSHFCVIKEGERGLCGVRENRGGQLATLAYERVAALNLDPVEKKPLYHFLPGTRTFSLGTMGCNFSCVFCQNDSLSQPPRQGRVPAGERVTPEALVHAAQDSGAASISYTYSEPTVFFELMADTAALAREAGLRNIMVSNGFQSRECLEELGPLMDAANIDLKAFTETFYRERCGARLAPVLDTLRTIRELGWWLEVTTLVIPDLNDGLPELQGMAAFIAEELGMGTPWHLSRFRPQYQLTSKPSTPVETLHRARGAGLAAGLEHVYLGNVPGEDGANTFCPGCNARLVDRLGFSLTGNGIEGGKCSSCARPVPGVWE